MTIRRATVADLPWLRVLFQGLIAHGAQRFPSAYPTMDEEEFDAFTVAMYRHLETNQDFACFVADDGGRLVGFIAGEIWERAVGKPHRYASPHYLYVLPEARGRRVAPELIAAGVAWAREKGVTHVELAAWSGDPIWEKFHFQPYLAKFWLPLEDVGKRPPARTPAPVPSRGRRPPPKRRKSRMNGAHLEA